MARIVFHVGAHKTATTYLQNRLLVNHAVLEAHNVHCPDIVTLRRNFTYRTQQSEDRRNAFTADLVNRSKGSGTLLISDENLIGEVDDAIAIGRQYGRTAERLETYRKLIGAEAPEVYFCIRDHASFEVSLYCEYLRHFPYICFGDFHGVFDASDFSWKKVVEDLMVACPASPIVLWEFGKLRQVEHAVMSRMIGFDYAELTIPPDNARDSFSDIAIRAIDALSTVLDQKHLKMVSGEIARVFPKSEQFPKFDPLSIAETNRLNEKTRHDIDALRAMGDRITFIDP